MKTPGRTSRNRLWNGYADRSTHLGIVGDVDLLTPGEGKVAEGIVSSGAWLFADNGFDLSNVQAVAAVPRQTLPLGASGDHCRLERRSDERM